LEARFMGDCSSLRLLMERQAQSMQAAESARQGACFAGNTQECATSDGAMQSEAGLYKALQERYRQCLPSVAERVLILWLDGHMV
jgi:hypothetical protein